MLPLINSPGAGEPDRTDIENMLSHHPELATRYADFISTIWESSSLPKRLLELLEFRVAAIHNIDRDSAADLTANERETLKHGDFSDFAQAEQAALQLAELLPFAHEQVDELAVQALSRFYGAKGAVAILVATSFFDVNCRLRIVCGIDA